MPGGARCGIIPGTVSWWSQDTMIASRANLSALLLALLGREGHAALGDGAPG